MNRHPESSPGKVDDIAQRSAVWTRHWATGAAHSCVGSYGDRYGGAIAAFWKTVFASLSASQRVLDVATGNGALPRLLLELRPELALEIDAVDLASIAPAWLAALPPATRQRVRFHGGQAVEALPIADASFDLIVSQYGIEYSDLDRSIPELLRVLAPGGRVALLMHASESRPVTLAAVELAHIDWLLSPDGLLSAAADMLEPIVRAGAPQGRASLATDAAAEAARVRFNAAQASLRVRAEAKDGADVLFEVQDAVAAVLGLAAQQGVAVASDSLHRVETAVQDSHLRLRQLRQHALNRQQLEALGHALSGAAGGHCAIKLGEVAERGHVMACTLLAGPSAVPDQSEQS